ncbi:hypothetical protein [Pelagibius sp.]|uniref:hypothetical protein n=1 Tax=Pelagibius sp. TaxID=1931238 RepID=UPI003BB06C84
MDALLPMIRRGASLLVVPLCVLLIPGKAGATKCWQPTPAEHVDHAGMIFYGRVKAGYDGAQDDRDRVVEFEVLRAYKGVHEDIVRISYFNDHGSLTGWGFQGGESTLVFAALLPRVGAGGESGHAHYCSMVPYHARPELHPEYWDALAGMK